ncbi:MAG: transcription elongation factor GreA, partial [Clostridia bacterium]
MADVFLTEKGKIELEEKLAFLKSIRRAEVSEKIKEARGFGDLSENAEYDAAKEEQATVEGEILELETKLRTARIIEDVTDLRTATIGCYVTLKRIDTGVKTEYQIVGTTE